MTNAKCELLKHIEFNPPVEYVKILYQHDTVSSETMLIEGTLDEVLLSLDFNYDSGYGGQELFGFIWYNDGTWSERSEYDGSEWWRYVYCPSREVDISVVW